MTPEQLFSAANLLAIAGWILLVFLPGKPWAEAIAGRVIPLTLAATYLFLLIAHWGEGKGSFRTLHDVSLLFASPWVLLAGWIHYLAFDLFIGTWEVRNARESGLSHWFVIPCLGLTFMFGPIGLLTYFSLKSAFSSLPLPKPSQRT